MFSKSLASQKLDASHSYNVMHHLPAPVSPYHITLFDYSMKIRRMSKYHTVEPSACVGRAASSGQSWNTRYRRDRVVALAVSKSLAEAEQFRGINRETSTYFLAS